MLVYPIFFIYKIIYFNVVVFVVVLFSVFSVFGVFIVFSVFSVFSVFCCIKLTTEFSPSEFSWVFYLSVTTVCYVILEVCSIVFYLSVTTVCYVILEVCSIVLID